MLRRSRSGNLPMVLSVVVLAFTGCARTPPPQPAQRQQTWEEFQRDHPDTFIAGYQASLAEESRRLRAAGLSADLDAVLAHVDAHLPPGDYTLRATGANAAILRRLRVESTANSLVRRGYRARHLSTPQQARSLVRAAADLSGEADALVLASPIVLVADLDRVDKRADGSADLVWRVSEAIKSSPAVGSEFRIPLNGPMPSVSQSPGQPPPPPPPPPNLAMSDLGNAKRALFFLQPPETVIGRPSHPPGEPAILFSPMPVEGEQARPGYHSATQETTLASIRAAARAQLCSPGYVPVARGFDLPHRC